MIIQWEEPYSLKMSSNFEVQTDSPKNVGAIYLFTNFIMKKLLFLAICIVVSITSCNKDVSLESIEKEFNFNEKEMFRVTNKNLKDYSIDDEDRLINEELLYFSTKLISHLSERDVTQFMKSIENSTFISINSINELLPEIKLREPKTVIVRNRRYNVNFSIYNHGKEYNGIIIANGIDLGDYNGMVDVVEGYDMLTGRVVELDEIYAISTNRLVLMANVNSLEKRNYTNHVIQIEEPSRPRPNNNFSSRAVTPYFFDRLRVNHRYEKSGNSEVWIHNYRIDENGGSHWLPNSGGSDGKRELKSVSKNQIGTTLTVDIGFLDPNGPQEDVSPSCCNAAFFAIWERDWYSQERDLGKACYNGTSLYFGGRRKFDHEWYSYDPDEGDTSCSSNTTVQESQIDFDQSTQQFDFDSNKGLIRLNYN